MAERHELEARLLQHRAAIERVVRMTALRKGLRDDHATEFASFVWERLVEHDYAVLRKFRGDSQLDTYLTVVISRLGSEYRVKHWGRWRPSRLAVRLGPLAVRLETLVFRDGLSLAEAGETLRTRRETELTDQGLGAILRQLPRRDAVRGLDRRPGARDDTAVDALPADGAADDRLRERAVDDERHAVEQLLAQALERLTPEDRVLVVLCAMRGLSVADAARLLRKEQAPLYRQLPRALRTLRRDLEGSGVTREQIRDLVGESIAEAPADEIADGPARSRGSPDIGPSNPAYDPADVPRSRGVLADALPPGEPGSPEQTRPPDGTTERGARHQRGGLTSE